MGRYAPDSTVCTVSVLWRFNMHGAPIYLGSCNHIRGLSQWTLFQFSLLLASFPTPKYSIAPVFLVVYSCCNNSFYSTMCTCHDHKLRVICVDLCACPHTIKSCLSRVYPCDIMYNVPAPPLLVGRAWELVEACCIVDSGSGQWNSVYL